MAKSFVLSKDQYAFFVSLFEREWARYSELNKRAQLFITIQSFILTANLFKIKDVLGILKDMDNWTGLLYVASIVMIFISLLVTVLSLRLRNYERLHDPELVVESLEALDYSESVFWKARVVDLAIATNKNKIKNDKKVPYLQAATWLIVSGLLFTVIFISKIII